MSRLPSCVWAQGCLFYGWFAQRGSPFQVCTKVPYELTALPARGCSPLTEILMILSNMTSGETWKSKTKYWRGEGPRPGCHLVGSS